jgi:hypothetical protein
MDITGVISDYFLFVVTFRLTLHSLFSHSRIPIKLVLPNYAMPLLGLFKSFSSIPESPEGLALWIDSKIVDLNFIPIDITTWHCNA